MSIDELHDFTMLGVWTMTKERLNLETKRILLRPFELSDGPRVKKLAGDKAIADTTLNIPHPYKDGMAEEWILTHQSKFENEEEVTCAIILKPIQELIGAIGLTIDKRFNRAELGLLGWKGVLESGLLYWSV